MTDLVPLTHFEEAYTVARIGAREIVDAEGRKPRMAVVVQGPYLIGGTSFIIREYLERNRDAAVIASTYVPAPYTVPEERGSFLTPYELEAVDSGRLVFLFLRLPTQEEEPAYWQTNRTNQNSQRLTSFCGLQEVSRQGIEYSLKTRGDLLLGHKDLMEFFLDQGVDVIPIIPGPRDSPQSMKSRIVVSAANTFYRPVIYGYHTPSFPIYVSDFFYFGHTSDLLTFFDMRDGSYWDRGRGMCNENEPPESNLTLTWMRAQGIRAEGTMDLIARYFILVEPEISEQFRTCCHDQKVYMERGMDYLRTCLDIPEYFKYTPKAVWKDLVYRLTGNPDFRCHWQY